MKLIEILKKLKYIRSPCKKCLVKPICKIKCDKLETHYKLYKYIGDHLSTIMLGGEAILIIIIVATIQLMRS